MNINDVENIYKIEQSVHDFPWGEQTFADCVTIGYSCWVLEAENKSIAGYAILSIASGEGHILNFCIAPEYRKKGNGMLLLRHLLHTAKLHNAGVVFLEVRKSNADALKLYKKFNFVEIGVRKDYYRSLDGREDALTFAVNL